MRTLHLTIAIVSYGLWHILAGPAAGICYGLAYVSTKSLKWLQRYDGHIQEYMDSL